MPYEVNIVVGAGAGKYCAFLSFLDRKGQLHEKQIRVERKWGSRLGTLTYGTARMTVSFEEE